MAGRKMGRAQYRSTGTMKTYPFGRICETRGCTTRLSIYNGDHLCASCEDSIDLMSKPTHVGKYL